MAMTEEQRLELEPFKTMAKVGDETASYLKGWKQPNYAYILLEKKEYHIKENRWGTGLMTLNVENRPDIGDKLAQYGRKGYRVIHYANFPKANDANPQRAMKARHHSGVDGRNPWDVLAGDCARLINGGSELQTKNAELSALQKKLAEYEQRNGTTKSDISGADARKTEKQRGVPAQ